MSKLLFVILSLCLVGCDKLTNDKPLVRVRDRVEKFQDGNVTCYLYDGSEGDSISCLIVNE